MICPKCGFEQEERLDCKECGIVFSKYNALFQGSESPDSTDENALTKSEFQELEIKVRELSSRVIDVEFEKAERKKLRTELKELEEKIRKDHEEVEARMQRMEKRVEGLSRESEPQIAPELLENLPKKEELEPRIAQMTEKLESTLDQLTGLWEKTGQNSFQLTELGDQITAVRSDFLEARNQLEKLQKNQYAVEPQTILEDDVKAIRKNLDELGRFISSLGRKQ